MPILYFAHIRVNIYWRGERKWEYELGIKQKNKIRESPCMSNENTHHKASVVLQPAAVRAKLKKKKNGRGKKKEKGKVHRKL